MFQLTNKLKALPHTVAHLLQEVMTRLELDHGADVTSDALSLLVCCRNGLQPEELQMLLSFSQLLKRECSFSFLISCVNGTSTFYRFMEINFLTFSRKLSFLEVQRCSKHQTAAE